MANQNEKESLVNVTIPPTVTKIQDEEFMDCVNLVSVILPESLKEIGEDAFWDVKNYRRSIFRPD